MIGTFAGDYDKLVFEIDCDSEREVIFFSAAVEFPLCLCSLIKSRVVFQKRDEPKVRVLRSLIQKADNFPELSLIDTDKPFDGVPPWMIMQEAVL